MRIVIANAQVPFVRGGAEFLADDLQKALTQYGYEVEIVKIPFKWYPPERIPEHILACRLLDLTQSSGENIDLLIGLKFPVYYIKHPNKVLWIFHQFKQVYDLWGTRYQDIPSTPEGLKIRDVIIHSDNTFLKEAKKIYTISKVVSKRLKNFNRIDSTPLYPPLNDADKFYCDDFGDYVFYPSRINEAKRQALAVESMKYVKTGATLFIAGRPDSKSYEEYLYNLIKKYKLNDRVKILGMVSKEDKYRLFAKSLGCLFIPYDEDYGFVTLESFYAQKPIITCNDSGGPLELVDDGINGYRLPPEPEAIANAIDELYLNREKAKKMGKAGFEKLLSLNISWGKVIEALVG